MYLAVRKQLINKNSIKGFLRTLDPETEYLLNLFSVILGKSPNLAAPDA